MYNFKRLLNFCIESQTLWLIVIGTLVLIYTWWKKPHPRFPPGPRGFPVFGVIPFLGRRAEVKLRTWGMEKYGDVMSVRLGMKDWVVLNSHEAVMEAFVNKGNAFAGRPELVVFQQSTGEYGVVFPDYSENLRRQRRFGMFTLNKCGFAKRDMEQLILDEADCLLQKISEAENSPLSILKVLSRTSSNIISMVMIGHKFHELDERPEKIADILHYLLHDPSLSFALPLMILFPAVRHFPYFRGVSKTFKEQQNTMLDIFRDIVEEHKATFDSNVSRDFIDAYIHEQRFGSGKHDTSFNDEQLVVYVRDLFSASAETTSSMLGWALTCLLNYPQFAKPLIKEIRSVFESDRRPSLAKKGEMPFTQAFIQELFRYRSVTRFTNRKTTKDTEVFGYFIPKGTHVMANLYAVMNDPKLWPQPEVFDPHRHIDDNGCFVQSTKIIPFSVGLRFCMGERLARNSLFLLFTTIVLNFDVEPVGGLPTLFATTSNIVYSPPDFQLRLTCVR